MLTAYSNRHRHGKENHPENQPAATPAAPPVPCLSSVASKIIADTVEAGRIKLADENATSKKFISYIPFYA